MADEAESLTLRILQEIREEQREQRSMLKDLKNRIDGNTVMLSMLAGMVHDHEQRIETMEAR
jgi:hypothetical protein